MFRLVLRFCLVWMLAAASLVQAQSGSYPNRPVKIVVPYPPGANFDTATRIFAEIFSKSTGQSVIVENKAGAAGLIAAQSVAHSPADGYTLLTFNVDLAAIVPAMNKTPPYDMLKDFAMIGTITKGNGWVVAVNPTLPVRTFADLVKLARSSSQPLNYGSYGVGSLPHLSFAFMQEDLKMNMVHIPYKGGAASYQAAMANEVQIVAGTSFVELIKSGRLRGLAIGGTARSSNYPDIPTLAESGYDKPVFGETYIGLAAPAGTPEAVIQRLSAELKSFSTVPDIAERIGKFNSTAYTSPEELSDMVKRDVNFYGPLVRKLGLSAQ